MNHSLDNRAHEISQWLGICMYHYSDIIMNTMASQITSVSIVCSTVFSGANQRKHQSSLSLAFVRGIHQWQVDSPHKGPVTWKMFLFHDFSMGITFGKIIIWKMRIFFCDFIETYYVFVTCILQCTVSSWNILYAKCNVWYSQHSHFLSCIHMTCRILRLSSAIILIYTLTSGKQVISQW